jgi:hypothetical protein
MIAYNSSIGHNVRAVGWPTENRESLMYHFKGWAVEWGVILLPNESVKSKRMD